MHPFMTKLNDPLQDLLPDRAIRRAGTRHNALHVGQQRPSISS